MEIIRLTFEDSNNILIYYDMDDKVNEINVPAFSGKMNCYVAIEGKDEPIKLSGGFEEIVADLKELSDDGDYLFNNNSNAELNVGQVDLGDIRLTDITEKIVLNSDVIEESSLESEEHGILAFSGMRKINACCDTSKWLQNTVKSSRVRFLVKSADGVDIDQIIRTEWMSFVQKEEVDLVIDLDTDNLGRVFETPELEKKKSVTLDCIVEIEITTDKKVFVISYPKKVALINTQMGICEQLSSSPASIDFGTTSTCVAIKTDAGTEMLTVSSLEGNVSGNKFENPTNLMVFDWDVLYKNWILDNKSVMPIIKKGNKSENLDENADYPVVYDFGYPVKEELGGGNGNDQNITDRKTVNAILSLIKMIPYQIIEKEKQIKLVPYNDDKKYIEIVTSPDEQDEKRFDPIAFYGYLIGKTVNDRSKRAKIHTDFLVTSPVKFNDNIREIIKNSLEHGLKRAVPTPMREAVKVRMEYYEPVAYIGAMLGTEYFKFENASEKFAVFDFGGGTLDFAFGEIFEDEFGETEIKLYDRGGDPDVGGEKIIDHLTFKLYCDNSDQMIKSDIPIEQPKDEKLPDDISEKLVLSDQYSIANTNAINYMISRKLFEGQTLSDSNIPVKLYTKKGVEKSININVEKDKLLEGDVNKIIENAVKKFVKEMDAAFSNVEGYERKNVHIFLAGNSSKQKFVMENMKKIIQDSELIKIPGYEENGTEQGDTTTKAQTSYRRGKNKVDISASEEGDDSTVQEAVAQKIESMNSNVRYSITPKTAVAVGQLKLNNIGITYDTERFGFYVGWFRPTTGEFKSIISKGEKSKEWKLFCKINTAEADIYYGESEPEKGSIDYTKKKQIDVSEYVGKDLYLAVRIKNPHEIECGIAKKTEDGVEIIKELENKDLNV